MKMHFAGMAAIVALGALHPEVVLALDTVPGFEVANPNWSIIITPEGYSDVALDKRAEFLGREYLSGEWGAAVHYDGGANPSGPIWLRKEWGFPCWDTNSNFSVVPIMGNDFAFDMPPMNSDGFNRFLSKITNGDVEITIRYEMLDTLTGIAQGIEPAGSGEPGTSTTGDRYVFMQTYSVKNVSGGNLNNVRFYQFLHGLNSGTSLYDNRDYGGPMGAYRFDNAQTGNTRSFNLVTGEIFTHEDTVCMHSMEAPSAFECGYYGREPDDDHRTTGKPSIGTHLSVEASTLDGTDFFDPPEGHWVSGAMAWDLPELAADASHDVTVLLSIRSVSLFDEAAPKIEVISAGIDGSDYVIDFQETTGATLDGFILKSSKDMSETSPDVWPQILIPYTLDVPFEGANRFKFPLNLVEDPRRFFVVDGFLQ